MALTDFLKGIADAIREKKGTTDPINAQNFASEIAAISSGGGGVESTSGTVTLSSGYQSITIAHGLSKAPKLFTCFIKDYNTKTGTNGCGFFYTEKIASTYRNASTTEPSIGALTVTVPNYITPTYGAISADDTNIYVTGVSTTWTAGDYEWEAHTW